MVGKREEKDCLGKQVENRKNKRITVISAYSNSSKVLIAPMYFEGSTDTEVFKM